MKTKNIGFWAIAAVMANLLAASVANADRERFSARLGGENEYLQKCGNSTPKKINPQVAFASRFPSGSRPRKSAN